MEKKSNFLIGPVEKKKKKKEKKKKKPQPYNAPSQCDTEHSFFTECRNQIAHKTTE